MARWETGPRDFSTSRGERPFRPGPANRAGEAVAPDRPGAPLTGPYGTADLMEQQPSGGKTLLLILLGMAVVFAVIVGLAIWASG
ncbi:hypothetical protein GCM10027187_04400 [Streptosporangium sandarakinum]